MDLIRFPALTRDVAVGLSGGADSMALTHALSRAAHDHGVRIHALIIDHGLRPESAAEAMIVQTRVNAWPFVTATIIRLEKKDEPITTRIQEQARAARYELMGTYCRSHHLRDLYLGHHADDQGETFLMRLCAGSGLDGLGGMRPVDQNDHTELTVHRPLLAFTHQDLMNYCRTHQLEWVEDPSNHNSGFERVRLRALAGALAAEGLTNSRLARTAHRLQRARDALEMWVDQVWTESVAQKSTGITIPRAIWDPLPDEIAFRLLQRALRVLTPERPYDARMKNLEDLFEGLRTNPDYTARTLGGCLVRFDKEKVMIGLENSGHAVLERLRQVP